MNAATDTLRGVQVACRCSWWDGVKLCAQPAPFAIRGTSYCADHAAEVSVTDGG